MATIVPGLRIVQQVGPTSYARTTGGEITILSTTASEWMILTVGHLQNASVGTATINLYPNYNGSTTFPTLIAGGIGNEWNGAKTVIIPPNSTIRISAGTFWLSYFVLTATA